MLGLTIHGQVVNAFKSNMLRVTPSGNKEQNNSCWMLAAKKKNYLMHGNITTPQIKNNPNSYK